MKKKIKIILIVAILLFVVVGIVSLGIEKYNSRKKAVVSTEVSVKVSQNSIINQKDASELAKVAYVIDGDTVKLEDGRTVRYIGIDSPEMDKCFAKEATAENKKLVAGKEIKMLKDLSETDKYGRILRYVYVGDNFVNEHLVRKGLAWAWNFPPDEKFKDLLKEAQTEAKENKRGLWADNACK